MDGLVLCSIAGVGMNQQLDNLSHCTIVVAYSTSRLLTSCHRRTQEQNYAIVARHRRLVTVILSRAYQVESKIISSHIFFRLVLARLLCRVYEIL